MFSHLLALFAAEPQRKSRAPFGVNIETARLILRPLAVKDWQHWAQLRALSRGFLAPYEPKWPDDFKTSAFYNGQWRRLARRWAQDREYHFLIFQKKDNGCEGALMGGIAVSAIHRNVYQTGRLGYWMGVPYLRQGFMFEAARAIIAFSFSTLQLRRLEAGCLPDNEASLGLLRKLGFRDIGVARCYMEINGQTCDHVLFDLTYNDKQIK